MGTLQNIEKRNNETPLYPSLSSDQWIPIDDVVVLLDAPFNDGYGCIVCEELLDAHAEMGKEESVLKINHRNNWLIVSHLNKSVINTVEVLRISHEMVLYSMT